jgi:hypothetical protein
MNRKIKSANGIKVTLFSPMTTSVKRTVVTGRERRRKAASLRRLRIHFINGFSRFYGTY